jgi:predicted ATPase
VRNGATTAGDGPVFVARGDELARLARLLDTALAGELSVCFVTGEAGSGKTALLMEFARRAAEADPDLVFAIGDCNAQAGAGDPYLPFREILGMLTGDVDGKLAEGAITEQNARRLTDRIQTSARTVAEFGPALIDVFVPGSALVAQVGALVARRLGWLKADGGVVAQSQPGSTVTWERDQIFEQFTNVLRTLSKQQPLALLIDDLHWADSGSVDLLFHLCRRLGRSRVLLIGAYRPADVALGRSGDRHPLLQVTNEVKRYFGDVWIGLDEAGADEERAVVDAMIDREPNRLGASFRDALLARTRGHPLFTDELLRALQERGELVCDDEGRWIEGGSIGWDAVPPRVEGVIGERIGRLPVELQDILEVAAVEGEDFTAESIARVLDLDRREVTRLLSRSLDRDHQLVGARGVKRLDGQRLSLYRFRHNLFQAYLYDTLDEVERVQLHEEVGHALSELYASDLDEVAAQLARHAELAGETTAAIGYLQRAGERARRSYANAEARDHFEAALRLLEQAPEAESDSAAFPLGAAGPLEAQLR